MFWLFQSILALLPRDYLLPDRWFVAMAMAQRSQRARDNDLRLDHIDVYYSDTDSDICTVAEVSQPPKDNKYDDVSSDASSPKNKRNHTAQGRRPRGPRPLPLSRSLI